MSMHVAKKSDGTYVVEDGPTTLEGVAAEKLLAEFAKHNAELDPERERRLDQAEQAYLKVRARADR